MGQALNFKIKGGRKLRGAVTVRKAKNSAVALLCAALLNRGRTVLKDIPQIEDVKRIIEVMRKIGVKLKQENKKVIISPPRKLRIKKIPQKSAVQTRSILLFLGPLIHYFKNFSLPHPGGCKLGKRTVRPHLYALERLGVEIKTTDLEYKVKVQGLRNNEIVLYEAGDTATENAIMAAALIPGETKIKFASANYQVQDLCYYLSSVGVEISGIGTSNLVVKGKKRLSKDIEFIPSEDPIEAMLFISLAATTNSSLIIKRCPIDFLALELLKLEKMGFKYKVLRKYIGENGYVRLVDIQTFPSKLRALEDKIHALPYPGINIDNLPFFVPIATQAVGTTLIHDWSYEGRAIYYTELNRLGADISLADPHRVFIEGPTSLIGNEIICPPALRPAAIVLIAMLAAKGYSILRNVYSINRGYESLIARLKKLGAQIEAVN